MAEFMITQPVLDAIESQIEELSLEYITTPGLILTEDDLKCLLYSRLSDIPLLRGLYNSRDPGVLATKVHSEVSWFDAQGRLTITPDLTILDPAGLRILKGDARRATLPSKGFGFYGDAVVLELKFVRQRSGITKSVYQKQIRRDWDKIQRLFRKLKDQNALDRLFCFFVIFNKGSGRCRAFTNFLNRNSHGDNHRIIYKSGDVFSRFQHQPRD